MKMPQDMVDTGVHYDAGEARHGRGSGFFKTGENFLGEDRGRVLRPREPAQQMDISDQGENLMALLGPFMDRRMADLIDKRLNDFMRNPPRMPTAPAPGPAPAPLDRDIDRLPVSPERGQRYYEPQDRSEYFIMFKRLNFSLSLLKNCHLVHI